MVRKTKKKPDSENKDRLIQFRLQQAEKTAFTEAAKLAGLSLSSWMRERLRRVCQEELDGAGRCKHQVSW